MEQMEQSYNELKNKQINCSMSTEQYGTVMERSITNQEHNG